MSQLIYQKTKKKKKSILNCWSVVKYDFSRNILSYIPHKRSSIIKTKDQASERRSKKSQVPGNSLGSYIKSKYMFYPPQKKNKINHEGLKGRLMFINPEISDHSQFNSSSDFLPIASLYSIRAPSKYTVLMLLTRSCLL